MTNSAQPRVMIRAKTRGNVAGFSITSKAGGIFGTQIFVRQMPTALAIKALIKTEPRNHEQIDALIRAESAA